MLFENDLMGSYELLIALKILLAVLAGGVIGLERERHGRPAGLRTHLLVATGACLMTIVSEAFYLKYGALTTTSVVRIDPGRIAAQIVTGIGFLGAGVILKEGFTVRGLTTAASLWMVAGIGMAIGMGLITAATLATGFALFSLLSLKKWEGRINRYKYLHLEITATAEPDIFPRLKALLEQAEFLILNLEADYDIPLNTIRYHLVISEHKQQSDLQLTQDIATIAGVSKIRIK